jgi:cytochrome c
MKTLPFLFLLTCSALVSTGAFSNELGDPERGKQVYKKCASCHMVGVKAKKRVGPPLNNIINAKASGVANFKYSKALKKAASDGLHWDLVALDGFIENPKGFMPKTKMSFRGLKDQSDRIDLFAYLATFSGGELAAKVDEGFTVSKDILALEGDIEYGQYLSSECTTCHQSNGDNDGIPGIVGWETEAFVTAMHAYREKQRENPVMQLVAGRLSNEEIAALAVYFKDLTEDN